MNATALIFAGIGPVLWIVYAWLVDARGRRGGARSASTRAHRRAHAAHVAVVDRRPAHAGQVRARHPEVHRDGRRRSRRTSTPERGPARPRLLVLLRAGPARPVDRGGEPTTRSDRPSSSPATRSSCSRCSRPRSLRWRHRVFFVVLLLVGMVIAVGAVTRTTTRRRSARCSRRSRQLDAPGLALRSTGARRAARRARARGAARPRRRTRCSRALRERGHRWLARRGRGRRRRARRSSTSRRSSTARFYGKNLERPENVPSYWTDAIARARRGRAHDARARGAGRRLRVVPWGNTVDPITPGLMDRPYVARELIPYGTPGTADLLERVRPPAPGRRRRSERAGRRCWRRMGVGDVVAAQRHPVRALRPRRGRTSSTACSPPTPGLGTPDDLRAAVAAVAASRAGRRTDEVELVATPAEPAAARAGRRVSGRRSRRRSCTPSRPAAR